MIRLLSFLFLFTSTFSFSQEIDVQVFGVKNGLPQSQITSMYEDDVGYLWIGTRGGGLARFDGIQFKNYTRADGLGSNLVLSLAKGSDNSLWIGGGRGATKFDGLSFTHFSLEDRIEKVIEFADTILCFGADRLVARIFRDSIYSGSTFPVQAVFGCKSDKYFVKSPGGQLWRVDKLGFHELTSSVDTEVSNIFFQLGKTYAQTSKGIYEISEEGDFDLVERRITSPSVLVTDSLKTYWQKQNGSLIRTTLTATGVMRDTIQIGANNFVGLKDREGITWFGSNGKGLIRTLPTEFEKIKGVNGFVTSVIAKGDTTWVGTKENGLFVMYHSQLLKHVDLANYPSRSINAIKKDNSGLIWIGTNNGIARFNSDLSLQWYTTLDGLPSDTVNHFQFNNEGKVWLTFKEGKEIAVWDGKRSIVFDSHDEVNPEFFYEMTFVPFQDRMYFGTDNSVAYLKDGEFERLPIDNFRKLPVYSLDLYKKKFLLLGSATKGFAVYNLLNDSIKYFKRHDRPSVIYFVKADNEDNVWIGTNNGVARLRMDSSLNITRYHNFGDIDGMHFFESSFSSLYLGREGKFIGFADGLYRFKEPTKRFDQPLHFQTVDLFYGERELKAQPKCKGLNCIPAKLELPFDQNHLTFQFLKINKRNPESVIYQYMLEGLETEWSPATKVRKVTYSNIPPGSYKFKVLVNSKDGDFTQEPLIYPFVIRPPFYRTALFYLLIVIVSLGLILFAGYLRVNYKVRKALERERIRHEEKLKLRKDIGRDFHDEMGNQLARIINYVGMAKRNKNDVSTTLGYVENSAKDLITGTKDFIWALDPQNNSLSNLFAHVRDFGVRHFSESGIDFMAEYEVATDLELPMGYMRQINLILKESLTNALKHSRARRVRVVFAALDDLIVISVEDDGVGVTSDVIKNSEGGVSNMNYRAKKINASISIKSEVAKGTQVELEFYLDNKIVV
ncbi:MAG: two-component regulator propeller domain-containing protein [Cyclobacteriaceae bacterium]